MTHSNARREGSRGKRLLGIAAAATVVAALGFFAMDRLGSTAPAADSLPSASFRSVIVPAQTVTETAAPAPSIARTELDRGQTLQSALGDLGLNPPHSVALIAEIGRHIDLRKLPAGTGLAATPAAAPSRIALRAARDHFWTFDRDDEGDGWLGQRRTLAVQTSVETSGGMIETSVSQALADAVESRTLVHAYADIFQWDVDLLVDPRPGDRVRAVYEVRRYGELPEGLPAFRGVDDNTGDVLGLGKVLAASYDGERAQSVAFWVEHAGGSGESPLPDGAYYDSDGQPLRKAFLKSPLNYRRISSGFSRARRHPVTGKVRPHYGVDFAAPRGTPVAATANGVVVAAGTMGGLGRAVKVRHTSGYTTSYGHFSRIAKGIRKGARVEQSQIIGFVGSTGLANGPHLHYTLYENGRPIDPLRFKNRPAAPLRESDRPQLLSTSRRWTPILASIPVESNLQLARAQSPADDG